MITVRQWFTFDDEFSECIEAFEQLKTDVSRENIDRIKTLLLMCGYPFDMPNLICNRFRRRLTNTCVEEHFGKPLNRVRSSWQMRDTYKDYKFQFRAMSDDDMLKAAQVYPWFWEEWGKMYREIEGRLNLSCNVGYLSNYKLQQRYCKIYDSLYGTDTLNEYSHIMEISKDKTYQQRVSLGLDYITKLDAAS